MFNSRLLGRFTPNFHFRCEHVLFVFIVKQKQTKLLQILMEAHF